MLQSRKNINAYTLFNLNRLHVLILPWDEPACSNLIHPCSDDVSLPRDKSDIESRSICRLTISLRGGTGGPTIGLFTESYDNDEAELRE